MKMKKTGPRRGRASKHLLCWFVNVKSRSCKIQNTWRNRKGITAGKCSKLLIARPPANRYFDTRLLGYCCEHARSCLQFTIWDGFRKCGWALPISMCSIYTDRKRNPSFVICFRSFLFSFFFFFLFIFLSFLSFFCLFASSLFSSLFSISSFLPSFPLFRSSILCRFFFMPFFLVQFIKKNCTVW